MTVVGFAGMTHLGLVSATGIASKGFDTVCYDGDRALVERLKRGDLPVLEPGLPEMLAANGARQSFTALLSDLSRCDVVYIAPDIPTDDQGRSDTSVIHRLIEAVAPRSRAGAIQSGISLRSASADGVPPVGPAVHTSRSVASPCSAFGSTSPTRTCSLRRLTAGSPMLAAEAVSRSRCASSRKGRPP